MPKLRALILASIALATLAVTSDRHMRLTRSLPEKDAVLTEAPTEIRLWFSQVPQQAISRATLEGPAGPVETGPARETDDPKSFMVEIRESLGPGTYTVAWRAAGDDGHPQRGTFPFSVAAEH